MVIALVSLAEDECFTGFPLGVERVEVLLKALLAALARVDGAAERLRSLAFSHDDVSAGRRRSCWPPERASIQRRNSRSNWCR